MELLPDNSQIVPVQVEVIDAEIVQETLIELPKPSSLLDWFKSFLPTVREIKEASQELEHNAQLSNEEWLNKILQK